MSLKPWQILNTTVIHQTPWLEFKADECETANGQKLTYTYARRRDEGPLIIPEDADGKLWLVRQYRHPIRKILWQFPAEGKSPEEAWEAAAQRGIQEEIGKAAEQIIKLGEVHPDPGGMQQTAYFYLALNLYDQKAPTQHIHEDEIEQLEIAKFSLAEIDTLIAKGEISDGWTLAGLFLYQRYKQQTSRG
jgi:8-oxo-dGTP pyrophosphatase MutT (NUDIX family)